MIVSLLSHYAQVVHNFVVGGMAASAAVIIEMILRAIPSEKPLSLMYAADDLFHAIGNLCKEIGDALDKILPNRLK